MGPIDLDSLTRRLGYSFKNKAFLKQALTHRSVQSKNNERLEFMGDSVLNFIISSTLFESFPDLREGELSRLRSFLVKEETLSEIASEIQLGNYLYLGPGELKTGGFRRASILADALEAVFAAIYFDGGFEAAQAVILKLYRSRLSDPCLQQCLKDAKTLLQEYLQAKKLALPQYTLMKIEGVEHEQIFHVKCFVSGIPFTTQAHANTRRKAEQMAARLYLKQLEGVNHPDLSVKKSKK